MKRKRQQIKTNINIAYSANSVDVYNAQVVNEDQDLVLRNELYSSMASYSPPVADTNRSSMMSNPVYVLASQINDAAKQGAMPFIPDIEVPQ